MPHAYDRIGVSYQSTRRPDPRIAALIANAIPPNASVLNLGAGTGSYEPNGPKVVAVEPSRMMISQREKDRAPAIRAVAESLPFKARSFDVVLGILTLHHWSNLSLGLEECLRVARDRVVLFTWDPAAPGFWLTEEYFPRILEHARSVFPSVEALKRALGDAHVVTVPIPGDCEDGFLGAYWKRPAAYLESNVRNGISAFALAGDVSSSLTHLESDIETGAWNKRHHALQSLDSLDLGYRLVVANV